MMTRSLRSTLLLTGLLVAAALAPPARAQADPEYDMGMVHMVFLFDAAPGAQAGLVPAADADSLGALVLDGTLALGGDVASADSLRAVLVVRTDSLAEAEAVARALPGVATGRYRAEVLPWYTARAVLTPPEPALAWDDYVFGLLVRGPSWTPEVTEATKNIQEGHMANINRLADLGKLVLAGPFGGGGDRRGVFIFKGTTLEEAQALTDTDPAVQAGRLQIRLYPWRVPRGVLP